MSGLVAKVMTSKGTSIQRRPSKNRGLYKLR